MKKETIIMQEIDAAYMAKRMEFLIAKSEPDIHKNEMVLLGLLVEGRAMANSDMCIEYKRIIAKMIINEMEQIDSRCLKHWEE